MAKLRAMPWKLSAAGFWCPRTPALPRASDIRMIMSSLGRSWEKADRLVSVTRSVSSEPRTFSVMWFSLTSFSKSLMAVEGTAYSIIPPPLWVPAVLLYRKMEEPMTFHRMAAVLEEDLAETSSVPSNVVRETWLN